MKKNENLKFSIHFNSNEIYKEWEKDMIKQGINNKILEKVKEILYDKKKYEELIKWVNKIFNTNFE